MSSFTGFAASVRARGAELLLPLSFFIGLGVVLQATAGHYALQPLLKTLLCWLVLGAWMYLADGRRAGSSRLDERVALPFLSLALGFELNRLRLAPMIGPHGTEQWFATMKGALLFALALAVVMAGLSFFSRAGKVFLALCVVVAVTLVFVKLSVLKISPQPWIDVFTTNTAAADHLLAGRDPYPQHYVDIYHGFYDYVPAFVYWPAVLLLQTLARAIFGDIRMAFVLADVVTGLALFRIARRLSWSRPAAALLPLVWYAFPPTLFVLEQSWVDTLLILFATLTVLALVGERWWRAGIALGLFCATKQYSVFFALLTGALVLFRFGWPAARKLTLAAVGVFLALLLPFVVWEPHSFIFATVTQLLGQSMRLDSLSIPAALAHVWGYKTGGALMGLTYLGALALAVVVLARRARASWRIALAAWGAGLVLVYGAVFLMGKQSFCNYYYLLAYFVLLYVPLRFGDPDASRSNPRALETK